MLQKLLDEVVLVAGVLAASGEGVLLALPDGELKTVVQVLLPVLAAWAARQKGKGVADLSALNQAVSDLQSTAQSVAADVAQLRADATPQSAVDPITAQVQSAVQVLQQAVAPPAPPAA